MHTNPTNRDGNSTHTHTQRTDEACGQTIRILQLNTCSYTQHTHAEAYSDLTDTKWADRHYTTSKPDTCMDVCIYIRIKQTSEQTNKLGIVRR